MIKITCMKLACVASILISIMIDMYSQTLHCQQPRNKQKNRKYKYLHREVGKSYADEYASVSTLPTWTTVLSMRSIFGRLLDPLKPA